MGKTVLVLGATGLIGDAFINRIKVDEFYKRVIILTRRRVEWFDDFQRFEQHEIDFKSP